MLTSSNIMFNLVFILSVLLLFVNINCIEISSYARVSKNGGSISEKSQIDKENHANSPLSSYMSHIESTLIDKQNNVTEQQQEQQRATLGNENVKEVEEKSEGRAIKSNYYFPLSDLLTKAKAMQSNSYKNEKDGRLIVYPSYTQNIDQTRRRYDMTPSTGQVAQKRFSPSEAYGVTGYKLKHPEKFPGYKYPKPNPPPPPPKAPVMMIAQAPQPPPPNPQPIQQYLPPDQQYLPPSKFNSPIVVAELTTEASEIMTVTALKSPTATLPSHFLPTLLPDQETSSLNPIIDLLSFNNKVNTSYMPPELHAIKDSIDNNHVVIDNSKNDVEIDTVAPADLHRFPPNINSIYQPADMVRNNAINYKSRDSIETPAIPKRDLHKFPPNIDSDYLPPSNDMKNVQIINSYLRPPSGQIDESIDNEINNNNNEEQTPIDSVELHKFPPNINSTYLPAEMMKYVNLYNSYIPPASGKQNIEMPVENATPNVTYLPPDDLHRFPPNTNSTYAPADMIKLMNLFNSYVPEASGQKNDTDVKNNLVQSVDNSINTKDIGPDPIKSEENDAVGLDDLHKFPPNTNAAYLPPEMVKFMNLYSSYLPPASGEPKDTGKGEIQETAEEESSVAPDELHKFPPNVNAAYLPPEMMKLINLYNSYLPPASGDPKENTNTENQVNSEDEDSVDPEQLNKFPPNSNTAYLPPEMVKFMNLYNSYLPPASGDPEDSGKGEIQVPAEEETAVPQDQLHKFPPNIDAAYLPPEMMKFMNLYNSYLPPAAGDPSKTPSDNLSPPPLESPIPISPPPQNSMMNQQAANGGMQISHGYTYNKPIGADMMMPPTMMASPAPMMDMPSAPMDMPSAPMDDHSHDHDHHHHHPWDISYPDIIYDDHHHHHHVEETTTTTEAPAEPRVKKYSYYYLGRKLWYIPLYFTFWFCLYVAALIIRSIGRHKVDLPNHYVSRSLHDMSHQEVVEKINKMTEFTMAQIEDFKNKYL